MLLILAHFIMVWDAKHTFEWILSCVDHVSIQLYYFSTHYLILWTHIEAERKSVHAHAAIFNAIYTYYIFLVSFPQVSLDVYSMFLPRLLNLCSPAGTSLILCAMNGVNYSKSTSGWWAVRVLCCNGCGFFWGMKCSAVMSGNRPPCVFWNVYLKIFETVWITASMMS